MDTSRPQTSVDSLSIAEGPKAGTNEYELRFTLTQSESKIRINDPSGILRAGTAEFGEGEEARSWNAKHAWHEGADSEKVFVCQFDEPLPPGDMCLRVRSA